MSGLLRRLAASALGVAPSVRPVVGWSAEANWRITADTPVVVPERDLAREAVPPRIPSETPEPSALQRVLTPRATVEQLPPDRSPPAPGEPDVHPRSEPRARPSVLDALEAPLAPRVMSAVSYQTAAAAAPTPAATGFDAGGPRSAPLDRSDASRDSSFDAPVLLPPRRVGRALPASAVAAAVAQPVDGVRTAIEETTEVHVTIGRIEVTAVHEAPAARREPARPRKPKSLEQYLAQRQGPRA